MFFHWLGLFLLLLAAVCAVLAFVQQRRRRPEESDRWFKRAVAAGCLGVIVVVPLMGAELGRVYMNG